MDLRTIENNISNLPRHELADFDNWYNEFIAKKWDEQFEEDALNGNLDKLSAKSVADYQKGKYEEI